jgi:VCBS repeat-containing protein
VKVHVDGVNDAPEAVNDGISRGYATLASMPITISAEYGVLINDRDVDQGESDRLKVYLGGESFVEGPTALGGKYTVFRDGSFIYDPRDSATIQAAAQQGRDQIDSFTYSVVDPHGTWSIRKATVSIVVKASEPYYDFEVVARSGATGEFKALGWGPSINNKGHIAFQGTLQNDVDSIYIWKKDKDEDNDTSRSSAPTCSRAILLCSPRVEAHVRISPHIGSPNRCKSMTTTSCWLSEQWTWAAWWA